MTDVRIVTDSTAIFIDSKVAKDFNITVVPAYVHFGQQSFRLGVDISHEEVLHRIQTDSYLPKITPPTADDFLKAYQYLNQYVTSIVSVHSSAHLNTASQQAQIASQMILGRCDVAIVDVQTVDLGLGLLAQKAAHWALLGHSAEAIVRDLRVTLGRMYCMFYTESMEALCHNGFIGKTHTVLGSMLGIRPFVTIEEGHLMVVEKAQTVAQAVDKLAEFAGEFIHIEHIALLSHTTDIHEPIRLLQDRLALDLADTHIPTLAYGAMLAALLGGDAIGLMILESEDEANELIEDTLDDDDY